MRWRLVVVMFLAARALSACEVTSATATPSTAHPGEPVTVRASGVCFDRGYGILFFTPFPLPVSQFASISITVSGGREFSAWDAVAVTTSLPAGTLGVQVTCFRCSNTKIAAVAVRADTTLSATPTSAAVGEPMVLETAITPAVYPVPLRAAQYSGTMTLREGSTVLSTTTVDAATVRVDAPQLSRGEHALTLTYGGNNWFNPSTATFTYVVYTTGKLSVVSSHPQSAYGEDVTFTATLDPPTSAPLLVTDGRSSLPPLNIVNGVATWKAQLSAGSHWLTFACGPGLRCEPASIVQTILPAPVQLAAAAAPVYAGATTHVDVAAALATGGRAAEGTIDVVENDIVLGGAPLRNGRASLDVGPLVRGEHALVVRYSGDRNSLPATATIAYAVGEPRVSVEGVAAAEGDAGSKRVPVVLRLSGADTEPRLVAWKTADRTAVAGRDYIAASGTVVFAPGETVHEIDVEILGNTRPEREKSFAVIAGDAEGLVRIVNDDPFYTRHRAIAYGNAPEQTLDVLVPVEGNGPFPLIVAIEAPSFLTADINGAIAAHEAERGYAVAALSFHPSATAPFPAQLDDARAALVWLRAHASEYALDAKRIGVWGIGGGGHLAALLATSDDAKVQAAVDWFGEIDFTLLDPDPRYVRYLGCAATDCPGIAAAANAATHASAGGAPLLMMHGALDTDVPAWTTESLYFALLAAGVDARFRIVDGAGHGGAAWSEPAVVDVVDAFFDEKLRTR